MKKDVDEINTWRLWEIAMRISTSKEGEYDKIDRLKKEICVQTTDPYFYKVLKILKNKNFVIYYEKNGDMQPIKLKKNKIIDYVYSLKYTDIVRDFIVKTNKWAIT